MCVRTTLLRRRVDREPTAISDAADALPSVAVVLHDSTTVVVVRIRVSCARISEEVVLADACVGHVAWCGRWRLKGKGDLPVVLEQFLYR